MAAQKAIVVGISGCSSSGKTTLARLLRDIFPGTFILHEDDFYKQDSEYASAHPPTVLPFGANCRTPRSTGYPFATDYKIGIALKQ
jgi:dephospho-CoA kinase